MHSLRHNTHEMPASGLRHNRRRIGSAAVVAAWLLAAPSSQAQEPAAPGGGAPAAPAPSRPAGESGVSNFVDSLIPGFQFDAGVNLSETYATNAGGNAATARPDYITLLSLNAGMHEHSRRFSLDANYAGTVNYFAQNVQPTQFTNNLDAVADVLAIPDYLTFIGKAFAQPVVISNVGAVTANGSVTPGGFRNGYGYSAGPDLTFRLADFATSDTNLSYGAAYFTNPAGTRNVPAIPGIGGPQDTQTRSATEKLASGTDFSRLTWSLVGVFSETARPQSLLSEKAGVGTLRYAVSREISLLGTGGYDAISNSLSLTRNVSGPVAMGGIALTFGEDLQMEFQAGQKYNSASYLGTLRWNISPTAVVSGSATDSIQTPESQLLNSLTDLTATTNGTLTNSGDIYANGSSSSLATFNAQPLGSSYNQVIARYQRVNLSFADDFERDHFNVTAFGSRETQLSGFFLGPAVVNSYGGQATYSHDITRLLSGSVGAGYNSYEELGGHASTITVNGQLAYSLSPDTRVYFRTDYVDRQSSSTLQALSPFTGSLSDLRITLGLSHTL